MQRFLLTTLAAAMAFPAAASARLKQIIVVHKTHFDAGCTALASEVLDRYRVRMADPTRPNGRRLSPGSCERPSPIR
ncbi:MAG: hypothetical protein ACE15B_22420 [Bryobacteraceae bacterium]